MFKKLVLFISLMAVSSQVYAGQISFDQLAVSSDLTVVKYNKDMNTVYLDHNSNINSANIADGTLLVGDFDPSASPQVRTDEGASCDFVQNGLTSSTTSGTLVGSVSSGTAYPVGYRINKASSTPKTFTASKWTYVDLDFNGNFNYQEVAIGSAAPTITANSLRLERVSTDGTQVAAIQDLRKTTCTSGPFSAITDTANEATLGDLLQNGAYVRRFSETGRTPTGWARGFFISWDTLTTFKVTSGSALINGSYRTVSADTTVTTSTDDPTNGGSGLDTGTVTGGPLTYCVYGVADQNGVKTASFTYSTNCTTPTGVTNFRLLGSIKTDASNFFTSADTVTVHGLSEREIPAAWATFTAAGAIKDSYNISSITKNGTGDYTLTFNTSFANANFACIAISGNYNLNSNARGNPVTSSSCRIANWNSANAAADPDIVSMIAIGDYRR